MAHYPAIDTELLRSFVAIADHGGFTRAAESAGFSSDQQLRRAWSRQWGGTPTR